MLSVYSRQLVEIDFLNRKVDLVHNDSIANREDVARMISELTLKVFISCNRQCVCMLRVVYSLYSLINANM